MWWHSLSCHLGTYFEQDGPFDAKEHCMFNGSVRAPLDVSEQLVVKGCIRTLVEAGCVRTLKAVLRYRWTGIALVARSLPHEEVRRATWGRKDNPRKP